MALMLFGPPQLTAAEAEGTGGIKPTKTPHTAASIVTDT
jgi:hypothetical protein